MTTATEIKGIRTSERIEFNPQQDLMGKIIGRPWLPSGHRGHGEPLNRTFMRTF